jgi:hypothetical protein
MRAKTKADLFPMGCTVLCRVTFPANYVHSTKTKGAMADKTPWTKTPKSRLAD